MKYILDTNVISELRKKKPSKPVVQWFKEIDSNDICISCITIGELRAGALKKNKTDKVAGNLLMQWVDKLVDEHKNQIIDIDLPTCIEWSKLLAIDSTNAIDSLIAAQCVLHELILVTRNTKHFTMFQIQILNPFE